MTAAAAPDLTCHFGVSVEHVQSLADSIAALAARRNGPVLVDEMVGVLAAHGLYVRPAAEASPTHVVILGETDKVAVRMTEDDAKGLADIAYDCAWRASVVRLAPAGAATILLGLAREADVARNIAARAEDASGQSLGRLTAAFTDLASDVAAPDVTQPLERAS